MTVARELAINRLGGMFRRDDVDWGTLQTELLTNHSSQGTSGRN